MGTLDKITVLKQYFGHSSFREGQEQVVDAILKRKDSLCVMPTGAGKSVCYQVPALIFDGVTLVISPLISLMKDQVRALTQNGIAAAFVNSSLTYKQYLTVLENIRLGMYKIVYVAPERLAVPEFLEACSGIKIELLAIDESHCISQWGQDFRPSYLRIAEFVERLEYRPVIAAFTATATAEVKDDIEYALKLKTPFRITTGFDRPNLKFSVLRPTKKFKALTEILQEHHNESGIIYCSTRKAVENVSDELIKAGFSSTMYHAGLDDEVRKRNQEDFIYDRKTLMVATNAFGMGIDKSNVSFVVHYNMPMDMESYYQEAGRAGRDGSDADCVLLYGARDVRTNKFLIENSEPNPDLTEDERAVLRERAYERLKLITYYSKTNSCLRSYILKYFGEKAPSYCGNCSNCLTQFEDVDITVEAQKILSCIKRTGERFGRKMICDVLCGVRNPRIVSLGLDCQSTYGIMKGYTRKQIKDIIDLLESEGYIETDGGDYPTFSLTECAREILFKGEKLVMKVAKPKPKAAEKSEKAQKTESVDRNLFNELKVLRRELADRKNLPAYIIFSNATLIDMCKRLPVTDAEMLQVSGVGKVKMELYGKPFLDVIKAFCDNKKN